MRVELPKGKYVLAVSGGVDSMALLDMLAKKPDLKLVVAHFNHGIRPDSAQDQQLVQETARELGLPFETANGKLGPKASEATARDARYAFLEKIRLKHNADAVITAHHQNDLLETAIINLLRGTGWRGLSSIQDDRELKRPLLGIKKAKILEYARQNQLKWREDSTNLDTDYLRNYVRHIVLPKLKETDRRKLISKIDSVANNKRELNSITATISQLLLKEHAINRELYTALPRQASREVLVTQLQNLQVANINQKLVNSLDLAIRSALPGRKFPIDKHSELSVGAREANLLRSD